MGDDETIEAAVGGDESAFERLMVQYAPLVAGYIRARTRYPAETEDVLQEVFLGAYHQLGSLRNGRSLVPWLLKIARHKLSDQNRRERSGRVFLQADSETGGVTRVLASEVADPAPGPTEEAETGILLENLRGSVGRLGDKLRVVLCLRLWDGCSIREIAERLGVKESTVRVRLHRGMKTLRNDLRRQGIDPFGKV